MSTLTAGSYSKWHHKIGKLGPLSSIDGIHGVGANGDVMDGGANPPSGSGVVGFGGPDQGTGVVGRGGGEGSGGTGVHGIGGAAGLARKTPPGTGVMAEGGRAEPDVERSLHGAGVLAIAGSLGKPLFWETGSVGVFAVGAEAELITQSVDGVDTLKGPQHPGAGVVGIGGTTNLRDAHPVAAGVIGVTADVNFPSIAETGNTGMFARGWIGIRGDGAGDRGGIFSSADDPQMNLIPLRLESPGELKREARAGDLLATITRDERGTEIASLWFCTKGGKPGHAGWAKIA